MVRVKLNPLFLIWIRPRATMRALLLDDHSNLNELLILLILAIITNVFAIVIDNVIELSFLAVVAALIIAIFGVIILSKLLGLTGRWLGGHSENPALRLVTAWSSLPLILLGLILGLERWQWFSLSAINPWQYILAIAWYLIMQTLGLCEVQNFPLWKAALNLAFSFLLIAAFSGTVIEIVLLVSSQGI